MYEYIKGLLVFKEKTTKSVRICVENNGIAYSFEVTSKTFQQVQQLNSEVKIYTKLIHKEDSMTLCGFLSKEERDIFNILTTVSGVGLKVAFAILDEFDISELISIMINSNAKLLARTKGIGIKLAQKIIIELKDKLTDNSQFGEQISINTSENTKLDSQFINEASSVLSSLGYSYQEIQSAMQEAVNNIDKVNTEEIVRLSLIYLSKNC